MKAIILAGGFGTRLKNVIANVPKPMAPIQNKPFLAYLLDYLSQQGITEVTLSLHYLAEVVQSYFQHTYKNIRIHYVLEETPLGTGGAIALALQQLSNLHEPVFVLNGDTFVKLNYRAMYAMQSPSFVMAIRYLPHCERYGKVLLQDHQAIGFQERGDASPGYINAGIYLLKPTCFSNFSLPTCFSFEEDFLAPSLATLKPNTFIVEDYFIDIGIPADYARAQIELPQVIAS